MALDTYDSIENNLAAGKEVRRTRDGDDLPHSENNCLGVATIALKVIS